MHREITVKGVVETQDDYNAALKEAGELDVLVAVDDAEKQFTAILSRELRNLEDKQGVKVDCVICTPFEHLQTKTYNPRMPPVTSVIDKGCIARIIFKKKG